MEKQASLRGTGNDERSHEAVTLVGVAREGEMVHRLINKYLTFS